MSRIGKQPIAVPKGVTVAVADGVVSVKGSKGESKLDLRKEVAVAIDGDSVTVSTTDGERWSRAMQGTTRALLHNMMVGVSEGYEKKLEVNGVGFEADLQGKTLVLKVGFNKPVKYQVPDTVTIECPSVTNITIRGIDKQQVGAVAAEIRKIRKPEPYKGKGIKYADEVIKRKAGKAFASGG